MNVNLAISLISALDHFKYVAKNIATDEVIKTQLVALSNRNKSYGYRRLGICLLRAGHTKQTISEFIAYTKSLT